MNAFINNYSFDHHFSQVYLYDSQTNVWENFTAMEKNFLEPLRETLKETRLQYQAEVMRKKDERAENKSMCGPYWMLRIKSYLDTDSWFQVDQWISKSIIASMLLICSRNTQCPFDGIDNIWPDYLSFKSYRSSS